MKRKTAIVVGSAAAFAAGLAGIGKLLANRKQEKQEKDFIILRGISIRATSALPFYGAVQSTAQAGLGAFTNYTPAAQACGYAFSGKPPPKVLTAQEIEGLSHWADTLTKTNVPGGSLFRPQKGQTARSVAKDFGISLADLIALNPEKRGGLQRDRVSVNWDYRVPYHAGSLISVLTSPFRAATHALTTATDIVSHVAKGDIGAIGTDISRGFVTQTGDLTAPIVAIANAIPDAAEQVAKLAKQGVSLVDVGALAELAISAIPIEDYMPAVIGIIGTMNPIAGAALAAAAAIAQGKDLDDALEAAAVAAIPGGALTQMACKMAIDVARGESLTDAAQGAILSQVPPEYQHAVQVGLAVRSGRNLQSLAKDEAKRQAEGS